MSANQPLPNSSTGPIAISGPRSIAELLDRTFRALRARFAPLLLSAALVMVPIGVLTALISGRFLTGYFDLLEFALESPSASDQLFEEFFGDAIGYLGALLILMLLSSMGTTLVNLMTIHHIDRFLHGVNSTVGEGLAVALRRFLPTLGMNILQFIVIGFATVVMSIAIGLIFALLVLVLGGTAAALGSDNEAASIILIIGVVIIVIIGYIIVLVTVLAPMVIFMARWLAAGPSLLIEGLGPIKALQRSWQLTKGRMWRGVLYVVLLALFSAVVISIPLVLTQQVAMLLMPSQLATIAIASTVAGYLLNLVYQPFYATGVVMYYYDLRVRAEAYDVALRVAALEAELAPDGPPA